ncbi:MAG: 4-alpha-glucanotransferase [Elusimicrobiota bacterium]
MKPRVDVLKRRAGVMLPLSSLRHEFDCGIGDVSCLPAFFDWMKAAGLSVYQVLPLNDLAPADSCPYTALSAFALDWAYISLRDVPEIRDNAALLGEFEHALRSKQAERLRKSRRVRFKEAREFKRHWLEAAFRSFDPGSPRGASWRAFCEENAGWLRDYALFRALKESFAWSTWTSWPEGLKLRSPDALAKAALEHQPKVGFLQYLQWLVQEQWADVRKEAAARGILLYGDIPFGLSQESADVWARQEDFDFSATMGAPPDQYSETGQAWGLPAYRWEKMENEGHAWWRARVRQAARLYDLFRLDHAVGYFRTWLIREGSEENGFDNSGEEVQQARGERFFRMTVEEGGASRPIGEDLGLIPPFVHEVLDGLDIPGYKVSRWEMLEEEPELFKDPKDFAPLSLATTGNHDTSTLAVWWAELEPEQRDAYWSMVRGEAEPAPRFGAKAHAAILDKIYHSGSALMILPFQDLLASRERINVPGTVGEHNWTYRTSMTVGQLRSEPRFIRKTLLLKKLAECSSRAG